MLRARGLWLYIAPHAYDGMNQGRPPLDPFDVIEVLESPDFDDGATAERWVTRRTIVVRYAIRGDSIHVRSVSCTRTKRA